MFPSSNGGAALLSFKRKDLIWVFLVFLCMMNGMILQFKNGLVIEFLIASISNLGLCD